MAGNTEVSEMLQWAIFFRTYCIVRFGHANLIVICLIFIARQHTDA